MSVIERVRNSGVSTRRELTVIVTQGTYISYKSRCVRMFYIIITQSPVGTWVVFQGVFRITTKENVEYLLQAANEEEREEWTTAIANAVRRLDIKFKV